MANSTYNEKKVDDLDWKNLAKPPDSGYYQPDPIYYHSPKDNKDYILFFPTSRGKQNCYKYDIINNTFIDWVKYPNGFTPMIHGAILNPFENCLYIFADCQFAKLNLNNDKWEIIETDECKLNSVSEGLSIPAACYIDNKIYSRNAYIF